MEYRNVKTGAIITTHGEIHGGDWEKVEKRKRSTKKKENDSKEQDEES